MARAEHEAPREAAGPADPPGTPATLAIEVVYCPAPGRVDQVRLELAPPCTVARALQASGVLERHGLAPEAVEVGVWGRRCEHDTLLRDRDRIELYRPLIVDPKEARRLRYKRQRTAVPKR